MAGQSGIFMIRAYSRKKKEIPGIMAQTPQESDRSPPFRANLGHLWRAGNIVKEGEREGRSGGWRPRQADAQLGTSDVQMNGS